MAQTKRKRRTKHKGNAAGIVERRGSAGAKRTDEARKRIEKESRKGSAQDRLNKPPSWESSAGRALIAAVIFAVALATPVFGRPPLQAAIFGVVVFLFYVPVGYYTDAYMYRRRIKKGLIPAPPPSSKKKA